MACVCIQIFYDINCDYRYSYVYYCNPYLPFPFSFERYAVYRIENCELTAFLSAKNRICNLFVVDATDSAITPQKFLNQKNGSFIFTSFYNI